MQFAAWIEIQPKFWLKTSQQTKTELSNELSRLTNTIEDMRKQLKQKTKSLKNRNN